MRTRAVVPTRLLAAVGVAIWAVLIALPLVVLYSRSAGPVPQGWRAEDVPNLAMRSFLLAGGLAAAAVVLGYVPGRILGTAPRYRIVLLLLILMPLLLPRYVLYYAWALARSPTNFLGAYISARPHLARAVGGVTASVVMILWYWPLAALLIGQGWRTMDRQALETARLDAGRFRRFTHVTLPLLVRPISLAFGVCFVLALSEFGTFHLAGVRTLGTELAVLYQQTWSSGVVVRAAWPMAVPALLVGVLLWKRSRNWSANPPLSARSPGPRRWRWAVLGGLLGLSLLLPLALLIGNLSDLEPLRVFYKLHKHELAWSLLTAVTAGVLAVLLAGGALAAERVGRFGRWLAPVVHVTVLLAMFLPGSLVAVSLLETMMLLGVPAAVRDTWCAVSAGQAARLAGLALILLRLADDGRERHLSEMAAVDGASPTTAWLYVHLPRTWPMFLGAFLLVVMLAMTELSATMVLLPAGVPYFAQRLLNQMHYLRDQQVITSCLVLVALYAILAVGVAALLRSARARSAAVLLLCTAAMCLAGCDSAPGASGEPEVLEVFGRTGRGPGEFLYPRAIALAADGSLFVVDKTGRIQHVTAGGELLGEFRMPDIEAGKPTGLTVGPDGNLYVADTHYHRVVVLSPDGKLLREFGRFGESGGCFIYPTDVAFSPDGRIFVSEYGGNDRISVFSSAGEFLHSFGAPGKGREELSRPSAVCVDHERRIIYVADACNHRIAVYTLDGQLRRYIGSVGRAEGELRYPYDLALTPEGDLLVCEYGNNRLQLFSPAGESLGVFGAAGRQLGRLAYPWGVVVDARRRAYVVDAGNNRVQVWQL